MLDSWVLPFASERFKARGTFRSMIFKTFGITESALDQALAGHPFDPGKVRIGFQAKFPENYATVMISAASEEEASDAALKAEAFIESRVGRYVFTRDPAEEMEQVVGRLLSEQGLRLAVAESCTGGMLAARITNVAGSSAYFERGVVAYSNEAKAQILGVAPETLERRGAVSEPCAREMAEGVRRTSAAELGVSVTGIAGPAGGTADKPVGLVFIGLADGKETHVRRFHFRGGRSWVRTLSVHAALDMLRRRLLGDESWKSSDYLSRWSYRNR
jgi:nicotinamide-nucleotide amidase